MASRDETSPAQFKFLSDLKPDRRQTVDAEIANINELLGQKYLTLEQQKFEILTEAHIAYNQGQINLNQAMLILKKFKIIQIE